MWGGKKVSVIFPTYTERDSIRRVINEFDSTGYIDEIIVVDNNAEPGTQEEVRKTGAKLFFERRQGFGCAVRKGIKVATGDLLIIAEPDGTYDGRDVPKLLAYSDDFDTVFCSRTHGPLIHLGTDMSFIKKYGDILLAKLVNVLFLRYGITDLGCTLRLTNRKAWRQVASECKASDNMFQIEWVLVAVKNNVRYIEIPINYRPRVGYSTVSGTPWKKFMWGVRKFFYIWKVWIYWTLKKKLYH